MSTSTLGPTDGLWLAKVIDELPPSGRWAKPEWVADGNLEVGEWYRTLWYKDDHMLDPRTESDALCGRPFDDPILDTLFDLVATRTDHVLHGVIYASQRKGGKCTQCKNAWKEKDIILAQAERMRSHNPVVKGEETPHTEERMNPHRRIAAHRMGIAMTLLRRELGAVEITEAEAA